MIYSVFLHKKYKMQEIKIRASNISLGTSFWGYDMS